MHTVNSQLAARLTFEKLRAGNYWKFARNETASERAECECKVIVSAYVCVYLKFAFPQINFYYSFCELLNYWQMTAINTKR